jgi:hypothetical protein
LDRVSKVSHILDAWLQFIILEEHRSAEVLGNQAELRGINLCENKVFIDKDFFEKLKKTYHSDEEERESAPSWVLSFPQIYRVKKGKSTFFPLFSLNISPILSKEYQPDGWEIEHLPLVEAGKNLASVNKLEDEQIDKLVTKEGLHRFLKTTFQYSFKNFEDWMEKFDSKTHETMAEPYLFRQQGSAFSSNIQKDLTEIKTSKNKSWLKKHHPAHGYLFGSSSVPGKKNMCYLGTFPTQPPTESQMTVLSHMRSESMTAVQGPPGSGKTTLILHAIAQQIVSRAVAVIEGKPDSSNLTLISSRNNKALQNVIERISSFEQPDEHLPVPSLYLKGGNKRTIDETNGAADQLRAAIDYLSEHSYSPAIYKVTARETQKIVALIKNMVLEHQRKEHQRERTKLEKTELIRKIQEIRQIIKESQDTEEQLQVREHQIEYFDQMPREIYEQVQSQFIRAQMQLPEKNPPQWIRWLYWLLGKTEPQIIAKAITDQCQNAIRETQGTPFELTTPNSRAALSRQSQRIKEGLSGLEELQSIRARLQQQAGKIELFNRELRDSQVAFRKIEDELAVPLQDFYQMFCIQLQEMHKELFHLSRQILLQEALRQKDKLIESLTAYEQIMGKPEGIQKRNAQRMSQKLDEHMRLVSLMFPVMTSSLLSVRNMLPWHGECINRVIIDEAGVGSLHEAFSPLVKARKALIVGDTLQLQPIVQISQETLHEYWQSAFVNQGLTEDDYSLYSPGETATATAYHRAANADEKGNSQDEIKLKEHFRCQQSIIDYCSDIAGYDLICKTHPAGSLLGSKKGKRDGPNMVAYHVEGTVIDQVNTEEVEAVIQIFTHLVQERGYKVEDIGVVSPFRVHTRELRRRLKQKFSTIDKDAIGTIHTFQGSERPVMIFSAKVCQQHTSLKWLNAKPNLLNVAVSRAKELLILVGNLSYLEGGRFTRKLIEHIRERGVILEYKSASDVESKYRTDSDEVIQNCEHINVLGNALETAKTQLCLIVPRIRGAAAEQFIREIPRVLERGVSVTIIYGTPSYNGSQGINGLTPEERKLHTLFAKYSSARLIRLAHMGTNERILLCDGEFAITGSWNWLSHMYGETCARQEIIEGVQVRREMSFKLTKSTAIQKIMDDIKEAIGDQMELNM